MDRNKLTKRLIYLIFFLLIFNFFANKFYWYSSIWWFDMPMHFLGGFWVGLLALYFFADELSDEKPFASILKVFIFVLIIGLGWEVFEFFTDKFLSQNPFNILDTASDIFFDLSGGLCAILYVWKRLQEKK